MNVRWQKIFDLFVIGDYLALDFVNNFTNGLKDFLEWFVYCCGVLSAKTRIRTPIKQELVRPKIIGIKK